MLHLTLQTLLDLSKYTQKQNNRPNEDVKNKKYEGRYPMVTHTQTDRHTNTDMTKTLPLPHTRGVIKDSV